MTPTDFLNRLLPFDPGLSTNGSAYNHRFLLKDISTEGLRAVRRVGFFRDSPSPAHPQDRLNSLDVLKGYTLLDESEDAETDHPIRDYYLWTAVARLMITAGDLATAAVIADHQYDLFMPLPYGAVWRFGYDFIEPGPAQEGGATSCSANPFLYLFPVDVVKKSLDVVSAALAVIPDDGSIGYKAMGSIDPTQLFAKMGAYPLAVHPKLAQRSIAIQLHYLLADTLIDTGLQLLQHWQPTDTSQGYGVYYFSDGVDAYVMLYDAPKLRDALIRIDAACGRTEADGAIVADVQPQFLSIPKDPDAPDAEPGASVDSLLDDPYGTIEGDELPASDNRDSV